MIKYVDSKKMGRGYHGWLDSHFHFSFAGYYNPSNIQFGALRVLNDDIVESGTGFETHFHKDMEIISYVVEGELSHEDSMKNKHTLTRGQVQYMSAGTGVFHSEHNYGNSKLRFLQIWILPDALSYKPNYGDYQFNFNDRNDTWLSIASSVDNTESVAPIRIHADINMYASSISKGKSLSFEVKEGRQAYLVLVEGVVKVNDVNMFERDAIEITEEKFEVQAIEQAHVILIEMKKEQ